jgi:hypothetical protein
MDYHVFFGITCGARRLYSVSAGRHDAVAKQFLCVIKDHGTDNFASKYQNVGPTDLTIR